MAENVPLTAQHRHFVQLSYMILSWGTQFLHPFQQASYLPSLMALQNGLARLIMAQLDKKQQGCADHYNCHWQFHQHWYFPISVIGKV